MFSLVQKIFRHKNSQQVIIPKWNDEIDFLEWEDLGLKCAIERNKVLGFWCGYVGVPRSHPYFGLSIEDKKLWNFDVHGGITYSGSKTMFDQEYHWFGFDCGHLKDYVPNIDNDKVSEIMKKHGITQKYRDIEYTIYDTVKFCIELSWIKTKE